jgi:hypothetical protein
MSARNKMRPGPGLDRPNKITIEAKTAIALAFEGLGGVDALIEWARKSDKNMSRFYTQLYARLIPLQVGADDGEVRDHEDAQSVLERIIMGLIAAKREGQEGGEGEAAPAGTEGGAEKERAPALSADQAPEVSREGSAALMDGVEFIDENGGGKFAGWLVERRAKVPQQG